MLADEGSAAFGRLCVETIKPVGRKLYEWQPPSGGCVLKLPGNIQQIISRPQPPSGGCVLKLMESRPFDPAISSRLRAAVC